MAGTNAFRQYQDGLWVGKWMTNRLAMLYLLTHDELDLRREVAAMENSEIRTLAKLDRDFIAAAIHGQDRPTDAQVASRATAVAGAPAAHEASPVCQASPSTRPKPLSGRRAIVRRRRLPARGSGSGPS